MNGRKSNSGTTCSAYGCNMRTGTNLLSQVKMYRAPKDLKRRQLWEAAVRRKNWQFKKNSVLCNKHFITGKPSTDPTHPDYVPSIFIYKDDKLKQETSMSRYQRQLKRRGLQNISQDGASKKRWPLKLTAIPSKNLPQHSNITRTKSFEEKREVQVKKKRCDNLTRKSTKISLFPSSIRVEIDQSPTEPNNNLSFEDSNGDVSLEQERTETTAAGDLVEKSSKPLPSLVPVHKSSLTFAEVLDVFYRLGRISEQAKNKLKTALPKGEDSAHVVEPTAEGQKRQYSAELRNFALSFYFYSYKAYTYAWGNYSTFLPPPSALRKGYGINGVKSGDPCESVAPSNINQIEQTIE